MRTLERSKRRVRITMSSNVKNGGGRLVPAPRVDFWCRQNECRFLKPHVFEKQHGHCEKLNGMFFSLQGVARCTAKLFLLAFCQCSFLIDCKVKCHVPSGVSLEPESSRNSWTGSLSDCRTQPGEHGELAKHLESRRHWGRCKEKRWGVIICSRVLLSCCMLGTAWQTIASLYIYKMATCMIICCNTTLVHVWGTNVSHILHLSYSQVYTYGER